MIQIPKSLEKSLPSQVKVILLAQERATKPPLDMISHLINNPLKIEHFNPLGRDQIYDRTSS